MKKVLFYYNWPTQRSFVGIVLDEVNKLRKSGYDVKFLSCDSFLSNCFVNNKTDRNFCKKCIICNNDALKQNQLDYIQLGELLSEQKRCVIRDNLKFEYHTLSEIKQITYKNCYIGYGALSSYVSFTRNQEPSFDFAFKEYFNELLYSQVFLAEAFLNLISHKNYDIVYTFNGRWADMRPIYDICINQKIEIRNIENIPVKPNRDYRKEVYQNCLPHNIQNKHKWILESWDKSIMEDEDKIKLGSKFFIQRKDSKLVRDVKVYTSKQQLGKLPEDWDNSKRNIGIFNSSEDEFLALGRDWDYLNIFSSQEEGIMFILDNVTDTSYHFYLRVHPNLSGVQYDYHTRLYQLEHKYSNITVIPADSSISTYTLIDECEKVIVFGSSTGVEACFWEKPVILLGGTFYYYLNVAYKPTNNNELIELISQKLEPKDKVDAIKFGFFLLNIDSYSSVIDFNPQLFEFFGKEISLFPHLKKFKSPLLGRMYLSILDFFFSFLSKICDKKLFKEIPK